MPLRNPYSYRKYPILVIDLAVIAFLVYVLNFRTAESQIWRLVLAPALFGLLIFNAWAWSLWTVFGWRTAHRRLRLSIEIEYILLLLVPIAAAIVYFKLHR